MFCVLSLCWFSFYWMLSCCVIMLSVLILNVVMLNIFIMSVILLKVVMLYHYARCLNTECYSNYCHYAGCHDFECHGATKRIKALWVVIRHGSVQFPEQWMEWNSSKGLHKRYLNFWVTFTTLPSAVILVYIVLWDREHQVGNVITQKFLF